LLSQRGGPSLPALLPPSSPMLAAIAPWNAPIDLQGRGVAGRRRGPGRDAVETLALLRALVILPVRRGDLLAAFVALGEKRSGDVYTARDLALLSAVANQPARDLLATLEPLNRRWASRGWPEVAIRVGIHTGDALVGNFGSAARVEYDARGDTVNVASRLEGLCDAYAARVVVSEATRGRLGDAFLCRPLDRVRVRGRSQPVDVHEIL